MRLLLLTLLPTVLAQDQTGSKYFPFKQINAGNVQQLTQAWIYHTAESLKPAAKGGRRPALEVTPSFLQDTLYISTPTGRVIALDPETAKEKWVYDSKINLNASYGDFANRGLAHANGRIYLATIDARLICLEAKPASLVPHSKPSI